MLQMTKKFIFNKKIKKGFTLIEMLVYISIMTVITLVLTQSLTVVLKSNRASFSDSNLRNSAYSAMEIMIREIRLSQSIASCSGSLLQLNQVDSSGNPRVVRFSTSTDQALNYYVGSTTPAYVGPLTSSGTKVLNLTFTPITTASSVAVRIQMQLSTSINGQTGNEWFYSTVVLRGSY